MAGEKPGAVNRTGLFLLYFKNGFVHAGKSRKGIFLACHKETAVCGRFRPPARNTGPRRGPGGDRKALWSPPLRRNPLRYGKKKVGPFPCLAQEIYFLWQVPCAAGGPKVSKGRPESPLVASAEAKPFMIREKYDRPFPLPCARNLFLVASPVRSRGPEGFQRATGKPFGRLRRGETLCDTEKVG